MKKLLLSLFTVLAAANCVAMQPQAGILPVQGYMNLGAPVTAQVNFPQPTPSKKTWKEITQNLIKKAGKSAGYGALYVGCKYFTETMLGHFQNSGNASLANLSVLNIGNCLKETSSAAMYGASVAVGTYLTFKYGYYALDTLRSGICEFLPTKDTRS